MASFPFVLPFALCGLSFAAKMRNNMVTIPDKFGVYTDRFGNSRGLISELA